MYFNNKGKDEVSYDAIVIGSGISGGWAAKELTEKGLKTLVLERGKMQTHGDYPTANLDTWDVENRGNLSQEELIDYPVQRRTGYTISHFTKHLWPKDTDYPYTEEKPFDWIRSYQLGGRSIMWGRQSYRLSDLDFEANAKEGIAIDWPIRYAEIAPWYDKVESFIGVSGRKEDWAALPDGIFQPPMDFTCIEKHVKERVEKAFKDRIITIGRVANLTEPIGNRGTCQSRDRCSRGCPFGAYFSSLSSTLPAADQTGNLTIRPFSAVTEIVYDATSNLASSVRITDTETGEELEYFAKIIFCCASTIGTAQILLNSVSDRFPHGMGNDSDQVGRNLMDHHFRIGANAESVDFKDQYYHGRRPNGIYIPRFRNLSSDDTRSYVRGFGYQGRGSRKGWRQDFNAGPEQFGNSLKEKLADPGPWTIGITGFGECLPYEDNRVILNKSILDKDGLPTVSIKCEFKENERLMRIDMKDSAVEMLTAAGLKNVSAFDNKGNPGLGIHEMGTARMGHDPNTSVLNNFNAIHAVANVYVTDGSFMTSSSCVNPSLTYMAFTARAVDHAVKTFNTSNL